MNQQSYTTIRFFEPKLRRVRDHIHHLKRRHANDPRRLHAYQEFINQADHDLAECARLLREKTPDDQCQCCSFCASCHQRKWSHKKDAYDLLKSWLRKHAHMSYYVWKETGIGKPTPPLDDPDSWEVVCTDQDHVLLSHPLLHHPNDFLTYRPPHGSTYADKARFAYEFPDTLSRYNVVLTPKPSLIPKLTTPQPLLNNRRATTPV